ncbi:MAG: response regulator [Oscillospiraceae bacterium]|nr:response regulator [Oscillospiraceae bacterium]
MYKVFFVDDEASMRAGIRNNMNWDNSSFTLAGEAPDGEMALSLMQDIMPDILVTDIRMPFMDGIELSRRARKIMPWLKIIILSGHGEFEYAKQAITIGVEEYLLKPVTSASLFESLDKVAAKIEQEADDNMAKRCLNLADDNKIVTIQDISVSGLVSSSQASVFPTSHKLRYLSKADIPEFLDGYLSNFQSESVASFLFMNYVIVDIITAASKIIEELGGDKSRVLSGYSQVSKLLRSNTTVEDVKSMLTAYLEQTIDFRDSLTDYKYSDIIAKAKEYIQKNFSEQGLSLHSVAKEVNVSPNHFSTIFSQETGETFINYVTRIRLAHAKTLLEMTGMRTADIAYDVGYNDTHYFSYVFKKNLGVTPREFRGKKTQGSATV